MISDINNNSINGADKWCESFPKTRTIPDGWDMSNINADNTKATAVQSVEGMTDSDLNMDGFPKINTIPSGWDLTDIIQLDGEKE